MDVRAYVLYMGGNVTSIEVQLVSALKTIREQEKIIENLKKEVAGNKAFLKRMLEIINQKGGAK